MNANSNVLRPAANDCWASPVTAGERRAHSISMDSAPAFPRRIVPFSEKPVEAF